MCARVDGFITLPAVLLRVSLSDRRMDGEVEREAITDLVWSSKKVGGASDVVWRKERVRGRGRSMSHCSSAEANTLIRRSMECPRGQTMTRADETMVCSASKTEMRTTRGTMLGETFAGGNPRNDVAGVKNSVAA